MKHAINNFNANKKKVFSCLPQRQEEHFLGQIDDETSLLDIFRSIRMREAYENMDCLKFPTMCRNDVFNRTLNSLSLGVTRSEFL